MAWLTLKDFFESFDDDLIRNYRQYHPKWTGFSDIVASIISSYWIYKRSMNAEGGKIVLGDSTIRADLVMLRQHGLLSTTGIQDPEVKALVAIAKFRAMARGQPDPIKIGTGSILSEGMWSPLLNDCVIVGGAHGARNFELPKETSKAPPLLAVKGKVGALAAHYDAGARIGGDKFRQDWIDYINHNPKFLWAQSSEFPRVLSRELIGLQTFGYRPTFTANEIVFQPGAGASSANFRAYLIALNRAGIFASGVDEDIRLKLLSRISLFLFGDPKALKG